MVVVSYFHPLEMLPPGISLVRVLQDLGEEVAYVGVYKTEQTEKTLRELGIPFVLGWRWPVVRFCQHPFLRLWFEVTKRYRASRFCARRQKAFLLRNCLHFAKNVDLEELVVWTINVEVASMLSNFLLKLGRRHVHWLTEYGSRTQLGYSDCRLPMVYQEAILIQSEINRARFFKDEWGLEHLPFVLPNKPYNHPRACNLSVSDRGAASVVEKWCDRDVILYQGSLASDRKGITEMIEWICEEFPDKVVAVMSHWSPVVDALNRKYDNFSYVPAVRAPHHLEVTSHAKIGLAIYSAERVGGLLPLNALYCAPNKTFEYAGFGIPLLCNNVPGLRDSVGKAKSAVCLDHLTRESVCAGIRELLDNYESYSKAATRFFDAVDIVGIIKNILIQARSAHGKG